MNSLLRLKWVYQTPKAQFLTPPCICSCPGKNPSISAEHCKYIIHVHVSYRHAYVCMYFYSKSYKLYLYGTPMLLQKSSHINLIIINVVEQHSSSLSDTHFRSFSALISEKLCFSNRAQAFSLYIT